MTLIVDSYAWVEFLTAGPRGLEARQRLESEDLLITPDLVLAEIARKFGRDGQPEGLIRGHLRTITALSDVAPVSIEVALQTTRADTDLRRLARGARLNSPSFADVVVLAYARAFDARVLTADAHFRGLPDVVWIDA